MTNALNDISDAVFNELKSRELPKSSLKSLNETLKSI